MDIKKPKINDKKIRIKVSSRPCKIIKKLLIDEFPEPGSAKNRESNAPENGKTTLLEVKNA